MRISLVIAAYNRTDFVIEAFKQVLDNSSIDEIIIVDDYSTTEVYSKLWNLITNLNNDKIKLFRNNKNLGPMLNKYEAVKKCKNDWCIIIDSDNIIDNEYITMVETLEKEDDLLYCPEVMYKLNKEGVNWTYKQFNQLVLDKTNVKDHINDPLYETWLNTGNYFFNRQTYLNTIEQNKKDVRLSISDSFYFSYLWLISGNRMKVVPELNYIHRVHDGSYYLQNRKALSSIHLDIRNKIKVL